MGEYDPLRALFKGADVVIVSSVPPVIHRSGTPMDMIAVLHPDFWVQEENLRKLDAIEQHKEVADGILIITKGGLLVLHVYGPITTAEDYDEKLKTFGTIIEILLGGARVITYDEETFEEVVIFTEILEELSLTRV